VAVSGDGQTVTIPAGRVVPVNVMDVYENTTGSLKVTKTIAGRAAGQQASIAILVACSGPLRAYALLIPAHTRGGSVSRVFPDLSGRSRCTVTEVADGHTGKVTVKASKRRITVTIRANGLATAHIADTYLPRHRPHPKPLVAPIIIGLG
jgi:Domain of unknown function (DUF5979)